MGKRLSSYGLLGLSGFACVMSFGGAIGTATAQSGPATPPTVHRQIDQVMVTARKREESLQDVPVAVTALDKASLDRYAVSDLVSAAKMTPQLTINAGGSNAGAILYLRGIGSGGNLGFDQTVGTVIDGVFYNRARWMQQAFMDMERIEVLKGPQALYFGKNTPAGVVIVTTADPGDEFEGLARLSYEIEAREWIGEAMASMPLSDKFGVRIAARFTDMRGWMKNVAQSQFGVDPQGFPVIPGPAHLYNSSEEFTGRITAKWTPTDNFDATLKFQGNTTKNAGQNTMNQKIGCQGPGGTPQPVFGVPDPFDDCKPDFKISKSDAPPELAANAPFDFRGGVPFTDYESYNGSLLVNYDMGGVTLTSVTGWNWYKNASSDNQDYSAAGQIWASEIEEYEVFSEELRLLSDFEGPLNFMLGAFYQDSNFDYDLQADIAPLPADPVTGSYFSFRRPSRQDGRSWSVFGEVIWEIVPQLELSAGARYSNERKVSTVQNAYIHTLLAGALTGQRFDDTFLDSNVSPQATLTWKPTDDLTLYGAYKTGFKAGGFSHTAVLVQGINLDRLTFDSEKVEGFEIGAKATLLDGRLQLSSAAYRYDFKDQQVSAFDAETTSFTIENAARTRTTGVELDAIYVATDQLQLRGNVAYNRARYRDFLGPCFAGQTQEEGCNQLVNPNTGFPTSQDLSGKHPPISPDWNLSLGFTYDWNLSNYLGFSIASDVRYVSSYPLLPENRPDLFQDGYITVDAVARLYSLNDRWELALIGRNLTNEVILLNSSERPLTGGPAGRPAGSVGAGIRADAFAATQRKRQVQIQVTYRF
ncbi:TonB-dependent receptor [Iodidimonas sp. SYSU 1G8]|uniref:TonB-dependent receptor n=1 Tax=Iodidimonas sp. SYSU 1G8 TaxID=3133967 RepID=UPI0031FEBAF5